MSSFANPRSPTVAVPTQKDYLALIFRRCVLALIGSRVPENTTFEKGMLEELVMFAEQYLSEMAQHLSRVCAIQRRTSPATADVALLLHLNQLNVQDLELEAKLTTKIEESRPVSTLNSLYFDPNEADIPEQSKPFFEHPHQLVASSREKPPYIPSWMPQLPADHTYMHTESHSSMVRDLREVRVSLVEEGRLAERALQRLLGDKGSSSIIDLKRPESAVTKQMVRMDTDLLDDPMKMEDSETELGATPSVGTASPQPSLPTNGLGENDQQDDDYGANSPATTLGGDNSQASQPNEEKLSASEPLPETERPKPLKIRLHAPHAEPKEEAEAEDEDGPQKLSLKFALRKPKKKKEAGVLGKRPRSLNIVKLAKKQLSEPPREPTPAESSDEPEANSFQAALASFVR